MRVLCVCFDVFGLAMHRPELQLLMQLVLCYLLRNLFSSYSLFDTVIVFRPVLMYPLLSDTQHMHHRQIKLGHACTDSSYTDACVHSD